MESNRKLIAIDVPLKHSNPVQFLRDLISDIEKGAYPGLEKIAVVLGFDGDRETLTYSCNSNGLRHDELFFLFELAKHALLHREEDRDDG